MDGLQCGGTCWLLRWSSAGLLAGLASWMELFTHPHAWPRRGVIWYYASVFVFELVIQKVRACGGAEQTATMDFSILPPSTF